MAILLLPDYLIIRLQDYYNHYQKELQAFFA